jgi:hypothetical protein
VGPSRGGEEGRRPCRDWNPLVQFIAKPSAVYLFSNKYKSRRCAVRYETLNSLYVILIFNEYRVLDIHRLMAIDN